MARREASETLLYVLQATLRLAHPVLPHVTERIWEELGADGVLARASWPDFSQAPRDPEAERAVAEAFEFVVRLRQLRAVAKLAPRRHSPCRAGRWLRSPRWSRRSAPRVRPPLTASGGSWT